MIVLDTNALVFWTLDPDRLTELAAETIESEERRIVSSISIWEIGLKSKRGALVLPLSVADYVERLKGVDGVEIEPVDERTWLRNLELDWDHGDPADRTVVATASLHSCQLVTSDARLRFFYPLSVW